MTVRIWDPVTGKCTLTLEDHDDAVNSVSWSHDGTRLASYDGKVGVWDPIKRECASNSKALPTRSSRSPGRMMGFGSHQCHTIRQSGSGTSPPDSAYQRLILPFLVIFSFIESTPIVYVPVLAHSIYSYVYLHRTRIPLFLIAALLPQGSK
jgi:WD40 repeat protein